MAEENNRRTRIQKVSVVDQVYDSIKKNILDGVWRSGDKLPSEGELAEYYGVNRLSVRMALQKLSALGMIETRVGEGSFVAEFSMQPLLSEIAPIYEKQDSRRDIEQLRNLLEGECINIAIQTATQEQKDQLRQVLEEYNKIAMEYNENPDNLELLKQVTAADFAFHYEIVKISGNRLYMDIYKMVQQLISEHISTLIYTRAHREESPEKERVRDSHNNIFNSIVNGDTEQARQARELMLGLLPEHPADYYQASGLA